LVAAAAALSEKSRKCFLVEVCGQQVFAVVVMCTSSAEADKLLYSASCVMFLANWIVDGTDSSERLILNVCRNISRVDADTSCPHNAAVCLISEY